MIKKFFNKFIFLFLTITFYSLMNIYAQNDKNIIFYGVKSSEVDQNMKKMTEDLFLAQLKELNFNITQAQFFSTDETKIDSSNDTSIFFAEISRTGDALSKWECSLHIKLSGEENEKIIKKEYDSYYKILMDSKDSLSRIFAEEKNTEAKTSVETEIHNEFPVKKAVISTDIIAGSWKGEEFIEKIIIMRGGRGFVIFKNGASMNISVSIQENKNISIRQTSNSNASYFPELPRNIALECAVQAKPIEWDLSMTENGKLQGIKRTLIQDENNENAIEGEINVIWTKQN